MLWSRSRNMQNYTLLTKVGLSGIPVLLKRGWPPRWMSCL